LLHRTIHVRSAGAQYVLQRISDVFAAEIHDNIEAVAEHLSARGIPAPRLIRTRTGEAFVELGPLGRWRLMPHLGGVSFDRLQSTAQARSAGALVGRFQAALCDFRGELAPMGIAYRDTPLYLASLRRALEVYRDHPLAAEVAPLAGRVFEAFEELGPPPEVPTRVIHGDLKLGNLLFESAEPPGRDRAFAVIDFDTLMRGPLWMELGDVWRSWCNPAGEEAGEDAGQGRFDMASFEASFEGFVEGHAAPLSKAERASLVTAPERLALELCVRFLADALEESYFAWDEARYARSGEHNSVRAVGQWEFYQAAAALQDERAAILMRGT
jgi:Ser/Thr protein kinase RdoA (MazF antagonist)